jgi:hypothetical protein
MTTLPTAGAWQPDVAGRTPLPHFEFLSENVFFKIDDL